MVDIGSALDPGRKRNGSENQNSLGIVRSGLFNSRPTLLLIADGMGGYDGGALASKVVVERISSVYQNSRPEVPPLQAIQAGITAAHQTLREQATHNANLCKMGSTVVAAAVKGSKIYLVNVGDSRAYLISRLGVRQISCDHTLVNEQVRAGVITSPRRGCTRIAMY